MKVWVTKYALTEGILELEAQDTHPLKIGIWVRYAETSANAGFGTYLYGEGKEWHRTREAAVKRAEEMRQAKIKSVRKQLAKLEEMRFE